MIRQLLIFVVVVVISRRPVAADQRDSTGELPRANPEEKVSFAHDVRPILSANCFACHGPDDESRQADLRLDQREAALDYGAIVPGDAAASLITERITSDDPELVMPPPDSGYRLTPEQIQLLQRWMDEGAEYTTHWSFIPPKRPDLPPVNDAEWPSNGIDHFILRRLEEKRLKPAPEANPHNLLRRVFLDLTGLPPSPETTDKFASAPSIEAYEKLVHDLLASRHFGEHWARVWLDLARYADTKGYEKDFPRDMWPFRDWVIRALNSDMPFDQFTIEQLAGDLLPDPSPEQLIATAFHRNTMTNDEGGTDDEEFRVAAVKDRIDTTMQVWMGLTAGCAKCHSHKFDPISHKEYYQLFAIFNQTADADAFDESPVMRFDSAEQAAELKALDQQIASVKKQLEANAAATAPESADASAGQPQKDSSNQGLNAQLTNLQEQRQTLEAKITKLPIMRERSEDQRRVTRVHLRGNFLEQGDEVLPAVPDAFGNLSDPQANRLGLARWLVSDENPLSARVAANRIWARFFGVGLVETEGDFGSQGSPPTHSLLLDWLATELRNTHRWSLKGFCKTIVMSSSYRQSSVIEPEKLQADPQNRLLSRGPRFRLPAESVRDQALSASGLLSKKMYGAPVMPPQPDGVWKSIYNNRKWETSQGEDSYRRALYTYWKRTSPYPSMLIFDAESRDVCSIRRIHTNTPLQALVMMNDPVYLEAAAALAKRMIGEGGETPRNRIERGFRLLLIRPPTSKEIERLEELRHATVKKFVASPDEAEQFLKSCNATEGIPSGITPLEFASYVVAASAILNLDEAIMRN